MHACAHHGAHSPQVALAHPTVCELREGEALFLPKVRLIATD